MKSGVKAQLDKFRTYKKESESEFDHPYKNPYTIKQYKKLGENIIAIAYEHKSNSIFNVMEKIDDKWKSLYKEEVPMKITKSQLKEIIKEEIKSVLTEGTRWLVGIEAPSGKIASVYGHWDGYPEHVGKLLKKYYSNPGKVKKLMKLGKQGISSLDKSMKGGKDHSFKDPQSGETVFYGRDRGEKGNFSNTWKNRDAVKFNSGEEYGYVWSVKDKKWYYKSRYSNPKDWTELK
jgi:hypothetical protein|tara:strand:+ start:282 stop:980 length:699 start_codon:yes stop_codon:yes gene_type:complete